MLGIVLFEFWEFHLPFINEMIQTYEIVLAIAKLLNLKSNTDKTCVITTTTKMVAQISLINMIIILCCLRTKTWISAHNCVICLFLPSTYHSFCMVSLEKEN
jgi:hypothetical protein